MSEQQPPEGLTVGEFLIAMLQVARNKENPDHRCECKDIQEMVTLHFEYHKLMGKIHEFLDTVEKRRQENTGDIYDPKEAASQEWEIQMLKSLLENEK